MNCAGMAQLADATDLKSVGTNIHEGSSPFTCIMNYENPKAKDRNNSER